MMNWNYRVFREKNGDYVIREVFYDSDGAVIGCTEDPVEPFGRSLKELAKDLEWFKKALKLRVLTPNDIPRGTLKRHKKDRSNNISTDELKARLGLSERFANSRQANQANGKKRIFASAARKRG